MSPDTPTERPKPEPYAPPVLRQLGTSSADGKTPFSFENTKGSVMLGSS